jgi:hypothetical protein
MTREELGCVLGVSESYLKYHEKKALTAKARENIEIQKIGRGDSAQYGVRFPWMIDMAWSIDEIEMIE